MKKESAFWRSVQRNSKKVEPRPMMDRIENLVGAGIPDVLGGVCGKTFFIELKVMDTVFTEMEPVLIDHDMEGVRFRVSPLSLRASQLLWMLDFVCDASLRNVFVLVKHLDKVVLYQVLPGFRHKLIAQACCIIDSNKVTVASTKKLFERLLNILT